MIDVRLAGRYRLESEVGSGGMTTVWMAVDEVLERRIAVKILQRHLLSNEVFCTRFRQEALVAGGLTHPTIAAVYDTGLYDDAPYVVTEYLGGGSLAKALSRGPLPAVRVASIGADICEALAVAHANGVSHGNLKPSNILFSDAGPLLGLVKVTDFGVGNAALGGDLTATGALLGTLSFLAPEVLQGADPGPAADIYSLGVVLFRALTGRPPRAADSELGGSGRPRTMTTHPRDLTPSVPRSLDAAIARALADDPSDRFADAGELGHLLRTATQGRAIPGDEPSMVPIPEPLPPATGRPRAGEDKGASTQPPPRAPAPGPGQPFRRLASSRGGAAEFVRTEGRWLAPVVLVVLLAIAIVVGVLQLSGHIPGLTGAGSKAPTPAPSVQLVSMQPGGILKPNPQGGDTGEHSNLVPDAFNGQNPPWETENYDSADFGGLRPGIGIYGDLGSSMTLSKIEVDSPTPGWAGSIRYSDDGQNWSPPPGPGQSVTAAGTQDFNVSGDGPHRYWMVWITSLPQAYSFQAKISNIKAFH